MITFGIADALFSYIMGILEEWVGRILQFTIAMALNVAMLLTMIFWDSLENEHQAVFYIIPAVWGISDAVWQTTTSGV